MNPNSQHQLWSKWEFTITPGDRRRARLPYAEMQKNCARFAKEIFNTTAGQMRIDRFRDHIGPYWRVQVLIEGVPVHDPDYREKMIRAWAQYFRNGFGPGTHTHMDTKQMAGDFQNGKPPEQLIIMPAFRWFGDDEDEDGERPVQPVQTAAAGQHDGPRSRWRYH